MKIGIIGAGSIGGTLVRNLTKLGHTVSVANAGWDVPFWFAVLSPALGILVSLLALLLFYH